MRISSDEFSVLTDRKAFTLLEVIVAMAILAISLTTLFSAQSRNISLATEAKFNTNAPLLAGLKLAELESGKIELVDSEGDFGKDFPGYVWKIEVQDAVIDTTELADILEKNLRRVDITVSQQQDSYVYTLRYYFRRKDGQ